MFLRHRRQFGRLGLVGYSLLTVGFLAMFVQSSASSATSSRRVAHSKPGLRPARHRRGRWLTARAAASAPCSELFLVAGIGYSLGGLLFGIALFRAGVLSRWASVLLAYGTISALALAALPESFNRPFAVPTGVALIGLGVSLWRDQRRQARDRRRAGHDVGRAAGDP